MNGNVKRFYKFFDRKSKDPSPHNLKMFSKAIYRLVLDFTLKHKIDMPKDIIDGDLIYGDLSIPLDIIVKDLEFDAPLNTIWDYTDECLDGSKISYSDFVRNTKKEKISIGENVSLEDLTSAISSVGAGLNLHL